MTQPRSLGGGPAAIPGGTTDPGASCGWPERLLKWAKRRPAVAGLLIALVLVSVAGLALVTWKWREAVEHRRLAERREAEARAVTKFFEDNVLAAARPKGWEGGTGYDVSLKDALDHAATKIDEAFAGQPEREAEVRNTIGMTYWYLGQFDSAKPHLEKAYRLRRECLDPDHPDTLTSLHNLGLLRVRQDRYAEAAALAREALEKRRRVLGLESPDTLASQLALSYALSKQHHYEEAEALIRPAVEACQRTLGPEHPLTLTGQHHLAVIYCLQSQWAEGTKLHRQVLEGRQRVLGPDHPDTLRCVANLGSALMDQGQLQDAEELIRQGFASRKRVLGAEHLETLWSQWDLADVFEPPRQVCRSGEAPARRSGSMPPAVARRPFRYAGLLGLAGRSAMSSRSPGRGRAVAA